MSATVLKYKINKSRKNLSVSTLKSAYLILKEFVNPQDYPDFKIDTKIVDTKIAKGIQGLNIWRANRCHVSPT